MTTRRTLIAWAQAAPLAAVFVVFFLVPLALILTVSFWRATDYELIPAFTLQAYADIFNGCSLFGSGADDACVSGRTYLSTLKFSVLVWLMIRASIASRGKAPARDIATRAADGVSSGLLAVVSVDQAPVRIVPSPWYQVGVVAEPSSVPFLFVSFRLPA